MLWTDEAKNTKYKEDEFISFRTKKRLHEGETLEISVIEVETIKYFFFWVNFGLIMGGWLIKRERLNKWYFDRG